MLTYVKTVSRKENVRSLNDGRFKVDRIIVSYKDDEGEEYRKSFEVTPGNVAFIPMQGTHKQINEHKIQYDNGKNNIAQLRDLR